jgi:hypothetical protein
MTRRVACRKRPCELSAPPPTVTPGLDPGAQAATAVTSWDRPILGTWLKTTSDDRRRMSRLPLGVMPGLDPGAQAATAATSWDRLILDTRVKPAYDAEGAYNGSAALHEFSVS